MFVFSLRILITAIRIPLFGLICNRSFFFFVAFFLIFPYLNAKRRKLKELPKISAITFTEVLEVISNGGFKLAYGKFQKSDSYTSRPNLRSPNNASFIWSRVPNTTLPRVTLGDFTFPCVVVKFKQPFI